MSKISLEAPFNFFQGKVCKHTKIIYKKLRHTAYTSQICNPRKTAYSAAELERHNKFKNAIAAADTALADPTQKAQFQEAFAKQNKYQTLRGFVLAQEYAKL